MPPAVPPCSPPLTQLVFDRSQTCITGTSKPCCSKADYCSSNAGRAGSKGKCKPSYVPKPGEVQTKCAALGGKCVPSPPKGVAPCCDSGALCISGSKQDSAPGTCQNL